MAVILVPGGHGDSNPVAFVMEPAPLLVEPVGRWTALSLAPDVDLQGFQRGVDIGEVQRRPRAGALRVGLLEGPHLEEP
jgi:hypothetical protein